MLKLDIMKRENENEKRKSLEIMCEKINGLWCAFSFNQILKYIISVYDYGMLWIVSTVAHNHN